MSECRNFVNVWQVEELLLMTEQIQADLQTRQSNKKS